SRLVAVTRGAAVVDAGRPGGGDAPGDGELADLAGLALAPLWGLLGSAEAENPGRFVLVDVDADAPGQQLIDAVACGESQVAVRDGELWRRRLTKVTPAAPWPAGPWQLGLATPGVLEGLVVEPVDEAG